MITESSNIHFLKLWHFNFSNIQTLFVKIFTKKSSCFIIDFGSTDKFLPPHQYLWSESSRQWNNDPLNFFWNLHGRASWSNERNNKASILLILLKCIVAGYSNEKESFTGRLFSNYGPLNMLFHFFRYLIYSVFHETFVKKFMKKLSFFSSNFKNPVEDVVYYRKLGCLTLWYWNGGPLNIK